MRTAPRLLLAATTWWPSLAVLASAFEQAGFAVTMLCPRGHIAWQARRFSCLELDRRRPMAALEDALDVVLPALIVPGDERMVHMLRDVHAAHPRWRRLLETAIGAARSHALLTARVRLLTAALRAGFEVPDTRAIDSEEHLTAWLDRVPAPWVLKVDGAWGGEGVRVASDRAAAQHAFRMLRAGIPIGLALRRAFVNGDLFLWRDQRSHKRPAVSAQRFVAGRPGNCAVFALDGVLLGATVVEAVATCGERGPSTLVRTVDRPDIVTAARHLVAQLGLSGFLGLDFIIDGDGRAALIEMNPRVTGPCRIQGPTGVAPIAAAAAAFGIAPRPSSTATRRELFASFPLAWLTDPFTPVLADCRDDLPWHEPDLLQDALRPLWPERGVLASLPGRLRHLRNRACGRPQVDYTRQPFAWWLVQAGLGGMITADPRPEWVTDLPTMLVPIPSALDAAAAETRHA